MAITLVDSGVVNQGYGSSETYPEPSGFAAKDLWVLFGCVSDSVTISSYPSGFSEQYNVAPADGRLYLAYKKMSGSESGTVSVNFSGDEQHSAVWAVFRGVDETTPFDVANGTVDSNFGSSPLFDTITTVTNGAWVLSHLGAANHNDPGVTYDSDQTEIGTTPDIAWFSWCGAAYEELATAGSNSDYTGLSLDISTGWVTMISALRPATAGGLSIPVAMHSYNTRRAS